MIASRHIVIVGASAAGLAAAETLRAEGYDGQLTMVGEESHAPYDRPPLSKQVLSGAWAPEKTALRDGASLQALQADWKLGRRATALSLQPREVVLDDGQRLRFDSLLVATGVKPRGLEGGELLGAHMIRTLDDAMRLRVALRPGLRAVVIGAGFLGTESASVLCAARLDVVLAYPHAWPLEQPCGAIVGQRIAALHQSRGVSLRPRSAATRLVGEAGVLRAVEFADGTHCEADLAIVAIGSRPATDWLEGSGLPLGDGVLCDQFCEAAPRIYAAGDVARWLHPAWGRTMRLEHRMHATEQGMVVARNMLGQAQVFSPLPYVWSDQFDDRLQFYGVLPPGARIEITDIDRAARKCTALYMSGDTVVGAMAWNAPREGRQLRACIAVPDALAA